MTLSVAITAELEFFNRKTAPVLEDIGETCRNIIESRLFRKKGLQLAGIHVHGYPAMREKEQENIYYSLEYVHSKSKAGEIYNSVYCTSNLRGEINYVLDFDHERIKNLFRRYNKLSRK